MKKCLIVVNTHKDESQNLGRMIQSYLAAKSIESFVFCFDGFSTENPFTGFDFVITLGGDSVSVLKNIVAHYRSSLSFDFFCLGSGVV